MSRKETDEDEDFISNHKSNPFEEVFLIRESLKSKLKTTAAHENILLSGADLENKVSGYIEKVAKIKFDH
jgi:hypothetical protein